jgi:hypothetical protein
MPKKSTTPTEAHPAGPRVVVRFSIPKALYEGLQHDAAARKQSVSHLIRDWLLWQCSPETERFLTLGDTVATRQTAAIAQAWHLYQDHHAYFVDLAQRDLEQAMDEEDTRATRSDARKEAQRAAAKEVPFHAKLAREVRQQHPELTLPQLAQFLYDQGIYRAWDSQTQEHKPVNPVLLSRWLRQAGAGKQKAKGIPEHIRRIAEARAKYPTLTLEAFSILLFHEGIYQSQSRSGDTKPVDTSTLATWLRQAIRAGLLS